MTASRLTIENVQYFSVLLFALKSFLTHNLASQLGLLGTSCEGVRVARVVGSGGGKAREGLAGSGVHLMEVHPSPDPPLFNIIFPLLDIIYFLLCLTSYFLFWKSHFLLCLTSYFPFRGQELLPVFGAVSFSGRANGFNVTLTELPISPHHCH